MKPKAYLLLLWRLIDPVYYSLTRLVCLAEKYANDKNILRVRLTSYRGFHVTLSDGTSIKQKDILVKIHLHNIRMMNEMKHIENELQKGKWIYRAVEQSLPELATYVYNHEKCDEIKGIIGITMLNRGVSRLGFETFDIRNRLYRWLKWLTQLPIHYLAASRLSFKDCLKHQPNYLFMSKGTLLEKYGNQHASSPLIELKESLKY